MKLLRIMKSTGAIDTIGNWTARCGAIKSTEDTCNLGYPPTMSDQDLSPVDNHMFLGRTARALKSINLCLTTYEST